MAHFPIEDVFATTKNRLNQLIKHQNDDNVDDVRLNNAGHLNCIHLTMKRIDV